ncbi:MAG: cardiolipin synthase ClsB [Burkholderiaceae bacterium]|nr:cardiolipin synthase ClsB [Burkholderiaceae bacterium]
MGKTRQQLHALRRGHDVALLEGSQQYFAALIEACDAARADIRLETYIFDTTGSGADVALALVRAARRGVTVRLVVDGVGTGDLPPQWQSQFDAAGVAWRVFSPTPTLELLIPRRWRRMHRKLCLIDGEVLFCGGINVLDDFHDPNYGALSSPRFDFAVRVRGPLVDGAHDAMEHQWRQIDVMHQVRRANFGAAVKNLRRSREAARAEGRGAIPLAGLRAALLLRDNFRHRTVIEKAYLRAIGTAHREIIIANAYFLPGRRLRHALVHAARRGVRVVLLLQGRYEYFMQYHAARTVYGALLKAGVEIHEYSASFLHAKVAVVDGHWATVGSSNLDPLSLLLAREANVVVEDRGFAAELRGRLYLAIENGGQRLQSAAYEARPRLQRLLDGVALMLMRAGLWVIGKKY